MAKGKLHQHLLIKNGYVVTGDKAGRHFYGDVLAEGHVIKKISKKITSVPRGTRVIDATDQFVIPGLIQAHVHLCQTMFKGLADDLLLLDWLKKRIWPMEHAHTKASIQSSALTGVLEMQKAGTTSILDMGTVRHTNAMLEAVSHTGIRYWGGKCLMDYKSMSGPLYESTQDSLLESGELIGEWFNKHPLVQYVLCPRFAVSCTDKLLHIVSEIQDDLGIIVHTHASENKDEVALVKKRTGHDNIHYLSNLNLLNENSAIAHCIHMTDHEVNLFKKKKAGLVHCPSSNLKLGSGIARIEHYRKKGLKMGLGADGAPCNNMMDPFMEMRLCALLQKPEFGPKALPAKAAFEMATLGGAKVLGVDKTLGTLEEGKLADIVTVDRTYPTLAGIEDPYSALVYSASGRDVVNVFINGETIVRDGEHQVLNEERILQEFSVERKKLLKRANI